MSPIPEAPDGPGHPARSRSTTGPRRPATARSRRSIRAPGQEKWKFETTDVTDSGILTTASDLLFTGSREGYFQALDARTGALLWKTNLGAQIISGPITYAVDGQAVRRDDCRDTRSSPSRSGTERSALAVDRGVDAARSGSCLLQSCVGCHRCGCGSRSRRSAPPSRTRHLRARPLSVDDAGVTFLPVPS